MRDRFPLCGGRDLFLTADRLLRRPSGLTRIVQHHINSSFWS